MRLASALLLGCGVMCTPALAQTAAEPSVSSSMANSGASGMAKLLAQGYEIKAAVPNGTKYIVFLQKDQSAYACEFVSLTTSRCGSIN